MYHEYMQHSFTCPLDECGQKMTVETTSREEAVEQLTESAKNHLASTHPEIHKTDEEIHQDIDSMTVEEGDPSENSTAEE